MNRFDAMRGVARTVTDEDAVEMVCYITNSKSVLHSRKYGIDYGVAVCGLYEFSPQCQASSDAGYRGLRHSSNTI